ncbi:hypothetical protein J6590_016812 [Homalodisca vitripennis]|nr:hypothetical protein J6590_016812 [Homalodisca vitripennis]
MDLCKPGTLHTGEPITITQVSFVFAAVFRNHGVFAIMLVVCYVDVSRFVLTMDKVKTAVAAYVWLIINVKAFERKKEGVEKQKSSSGSPETRSRRSRAWNKDQTHLFFLSFSAVELFYAVCPQSDPFIHDCSLSDKVIFIPPRRVCTVQVALMWCSYHTHKQARGGQRRANSGVRDTSLLRTRHRVQNYP